MDENKIVIYQTEDGQTQIDVRLENDTVWLNVAQMASLFMKEESNVRRHVLNALKDGELERDDNNVHFLHVNGVKKPVPFYSLDVIISVGYRVHSKRGTAFRIWARKIIKDYLVKGYAVNGSVCDFQGIANSLIAYAKVNSSSIDMELVKRVISHRVKLE